MTDPLPKRTKDAPLHDPADCYRPQPGEPGHEYGWYAHMEDGNYVLVAPAGKRLPDGWGPYRSVEPLVCLQLSADCVAANGFRKEKADDA
jgi:hypothetical protein